MPKGEGLDSGAVERSHDVILIKAFGLIWFCAMTRQQDAERNSPSCSCPHAGCAGF